VVVLTPNDLAPRAPAFMPGLGALFSAHDARLGAIRGGTRYNRHMLLRKANLYRLDPTPDQAATFGQWAGACRLVFNLGLEQRRDWWRPGRRFSYASQCQELTMLRSEVDWLAAVPVHALQQALKDLDQAYRNGWAGRAERPTPRKRGLNDSFRFPDPNTFAFKRLSRRVGAVKLPKVGWVKFTLDRALLGDPRNITVTRRLGHWYIAVQCEREMLDPLPSSLPATGLDRGVAVFAASSEGRLFEALHAWRRIERKLAKAQRKLARMVKLSQGWRKQKARIAKLHAKAADARRDYLHKLSTEIAKSHGTVVVEKLQIKNMSRSARGTIEQPGKNVRAKAGLNRSILDQGWGMFGGFLKYKLAERGGTLIEVDPAYTSQTCSCCGIVDAASRVSRDRFVCRACGHDEHADVNAAKNILRRGTSQPMPVEGRRRAPREAGTSRRAA
jgi:putative transposase